MAQYSRITSCGIIRIRNAELQYSAQCVVFWLTFLFMSYFWCISVAFQSLLHINPSFVWQHYWCSSTTKEFQGTLLGFHNPNQGFKSNKNKSKASPGKSRRNIPEINKIIKITLLFLKYLSRIDIKYTVEDKVLVTFLLCPQVALSV